MIRSLCVALMALPLGGGAAAADSPSLLIESPRELGGVATRLRTPDRERLAVEMQLVGLTDAGEPIHVILAPERSDAARHAPPWVAGYAEGDRGIVVLLTGRTPSYPDGSLENVLHHEIAHVLIARAAKGNPVPRWFNEGLAMIAARDWDLEDQARLALDLLPGRKIRLWELDELFDRGQAPARRAYTLSAAFVGDLLDREGLAVSGRILQWIGRGEPFEEAFQRATGQTLAAAEVSFWKRQNLWNRWIPLLTGSFTLWTAITLLAIYAMKKRRERDIRMKKDWAEEEAWMEEGPDRHLLN